MSELQRKLKRQELIRDKIIIPDDSNEIYEIVHVPDDIQPYLNMQINFQTYFEIMMENADELRVSIDSS